VPALLLALGSFALAAPAQAAAPVASFTVSPRAPVTGETVVFTSTSSDADGRIVRQAWDLDHDGHYDDGTATTASVSNFTRGNHTVGLLVVDDDGNRRTASKTVAVGANQAPTAAFAASPSAVDTGQATTLTSSSTDPDGRPLTEAWDLDNNGTFGDAIGHVVSASWDTSGTKTVTLRVTDSGGSVRTVSHQVTVHNPPSSAPFSSPSPPSSMQPVSPKLLKPFPLIRISGMTTATGVRIDLLSVRTGHSTKVTIRCKGRHKGCPFKRRVVVARGKVRRRHMPGFNRRHLRAGAVVEVFVTRPGAIGKYTRFKVRRLKPPTRVDSCTAVSVAKVKRCPSA